MLGDVEDKHVAQAGKYKRKKRPALRWAALAACLCLALGWGYLHSDFRVLLATWGDVDNAAHMTALQVEDRLAVYEEVRLRRGDLGDYLGAAYDSADSRSWYCPKGMDTPQYLILEEAGAYTLWIFRSFQVRDPDSEAEEETEWYEENYPNLDFSPYTYGDVYRIIFGVESADEIAALTARPSTANNTAAGKEIQKQVGTHTWRDSETIQTFYDITKDVVCLGDSGWQDYYDTGSRFTYSFSTNEQDKLTSGESTWGSRYLTVRLKGGGRIDSWKYDALKGMFYEFGGIGTVPLEEDEVYALNAIFDIQ